MQVTENLLAALLKCRYKAYLKSTGIAGEPSEYDKLQARLTSEYQLAARREWVKSLGQRTVADDPQSLPDTMRSGTDVILNVTVHDIGHSCHLDALERVGGGIYTPVMFTPHTRVTPDDRLQLAFGASILARMQGTQLGVGRIVHGRQFKTSRVALATLAGPVHDAVNQLRALGESATPPPRLLNRHCGECEFRRSCREAAVEKDDLSLLRGLPPKEIASLNRKRPVARRVAQAGRAVP
jgi:predicted RecB family nuclease